MRGRRIHRTGGAPVTRGLVIGVGLGLMLALTACGSEPDVTGVASAATAPSAEQSPATGQATSAASVGGSVQEQARAYGECLEEHDVVVRQDPGGAPEPDKEKTPIAVVDQALKACEQVRPPEDLPEPPDADDLQRRREFAACIREHGVPDWPDPEADGSSGEELDGRLKENAELPSALEACEHINQGGDGQGKAGG